MPLNADYSFRPSFDFYEIEILVKSEPFVMKAIL